MGLFSFIKEAGEKLFGGKDAQAATAAAPTQDELNAKASKEDQQKHNDFVRRMVERGYTEKQVRLLSEWYLRVRKSQ